MGSFLTADTVRGNAYQPLSQNLYAYVLGNPMRYTDPSGHAAAYEGDTSPVSYAKCGSKNLGDAYLNIYGQKFMDLGDDILGAFQGILRASERRGQAMFNNPGIYDVVNWASFELADKSFVP